MGGGSEHNFLPLKILKSVNQLNYKTLSLQQLEFLKSYSSIIKYKREKGRNVQEEFEEFSQKEKKRKKKKSEEFEEETGTRLYMLKGIVHIGFSFS